MQDSECKPIDVKDQVSADMSVDSIGQYSTDCTYSVRITLEECHKKIAFDVVYLSAICVSVRYTTKCQFRKINNRSYIGGIRLHCPFSHVASRYIYRTHDLGFTLDLALKKRLKATWKWPVIACLDNYCIYAFLSI